MTRAEMSTRPVREGRMCYDAQYRDPQTSASCVQYQPEMESRPGTWILASCAA